MGAVAWGQVRATAARVGAARMAAVKVSAAAVLQMADREVN